MKISYAILLAVILLTGIAQADIYVKSKTHSDAFSIMGQSQPEKNDVAEQWIGNDLFANLTKDMSHIVNLKKNLITFVNHAEKTYLESGLPLDMSKILPAEMAQMGALMKMTVKVDPNGQTKKVGQWNCTGYDATISMMMMPMKMTIWASTDVPAELASYMEKAYGSVLKAQMMLDDAALAEMKKVKGFWIATQITMEMMGAKMNTTTEVTEISKKTPDASVYAVPPGYKKTDKLSAASMQKR